MPVSRRGPHGFSLHSKDLEVHHGEEEGEEEIREEEKKGRGGRQEEENNEGGAEEVREEEDGSQAQGTGVKARDRTNACAGARVRTVMAPVSELGFWQRQWQWQRRRRRRLNARCIGLSRKAVARARGAASPALHRLCEANSIGMT
jgi:hypothetical protein